VEDVSFNKLPSLSFASLLDKTLALPSFKLTVACKSMAISFYNFDRIHGQSLLATIAMTVALPHRALGQGAQVIQCGIFL